MVHRNMRNGSRVADELYIKRVLMVLEDFLFFSLYSLSCIASNSPTLKHILILVPRYALRVQSCNIHITCVRPRPLQLYCDSRCSQSFRWCSEACRRRTKTCRRRSQTCRQRSQVLPGAPKVLSGAPRCSQTCHNHSHGTAGQVIRDLSYSEGRLECPPRV